jgi:hypothetical protein
MNLWHLLKDFKIKIHILKAKTHKLNFKAKAINNLFLSKIVLISATVKTFWKIIQVQVFIKILNLIPLQIKNLVSHIRVKILVDNSL